MTAKKTGSASAAAEAQKKRKRDKTEDSRRLKKRKPQENAEAADESKEGTESSMAVVATQAGQVTKKAAAWKLLEPMGGCMADVDPVFTTDENRLILTYNTSIQVYSTEDSLLERRIRLPDETGAASRRIVATVLSPVSPELVWVGCADGSLFRVNWKTGAIEPMHRRKQTKEQTVSQLADMAVDVVPLGNGKPKEVLFLSEGTANVWQVAAYEADALANKTGGRTHLFSHPGGKAIDQLRTAGQGRVVVGAQGSTLFVAGLKPGSGSKLAYEVYAFDAADEVASLDVRAAKETQVDVVVGCVRGAIYVYGDVLKRLQTAAAGDPLKKKGIKPRKHHWHSRTVHAVKWSRDGQYFISGGQENVLVMWQTDTGRLEVLPHLAASIENIVVSPRGASYAVHLDDNSAMVLSTAEMKPTCYVSGVQSLTLSETPRKDANVRRVWQPAETISRPVPAAVSPTDASRLLVRVSNGQKAAKTADEWPSASLLQTFDIAAFQSIGKQPLARTNPTDRNLTKDGFPVTEPTITHLCTSRDGRWLASVDEWQPPARDISGIAGEPSLQGEWARERREVHLKFWSVQEAGENGENGSDSAYYELVTRVDEAHFTTRAESIFAVAADSGRTRRFATLGDDGIVRFWGLRQRMQNGVQVRNKAGQPVVSWYCTQTVELPLGAADTQSSGVVDGEVVAREPGPRGPRSGALAFSEDGSTVFVAFGAADEALLYVLDAESGAVRNTLSGLFRGHVRGLDSLGPALLLLSEDLRVYDVVADELRYSVHLDGLLSMSALSQLAVARQSQTFAVSVAVPSPAGQKWPGSRLLLFSPDDAAPLFARELPHLVVSLLPAVGASGFLALDASAQIWSAVHAADTASLGQPLAALGLTSQQQQEVVVNGGADSDDEDREMADVNDEKEEEEEEEDDDDDDNHAAVIAPQKLRDIFEAAPATAASIEELFWEVSGLLTALPPVVPAGRS